MWYDKAEHQRPKYTGIPFTTKSWKLGRNFYEGWC